jgi:squalene-hopene/tetraprenyl-beta-curcumene cyclase
MMNMEKGLTRCGAQSTPPIPKGLRRKAQGCEERATLGERNESPTTPKGLRQGQNISCILAIGANLMQPRSWLCAFLVIVITVLSSFGLTAIAAQNVVAPKMSDPSVRNEVQHAIDRGLKWLEKNQQTNGFWSMEEQPALTALVLLAFQGEPGSRYSKTQPDFLKRGYSYLESCVQPDGSIYRKKELLTHNTALSVLALSAAKDPKYDNAIRKGRQFLVGLQNDFGTAGKTDDVFDGGVGYGTKYEHSDMANTLSALEALHYTKDIARDKGWDDAKDLNWSAAIAFLENCQHLKRYNEQPWASDDKRNKGGFIYYPGHSMAGETNLESGRVALRSYGSASYAGLLSYIYADLKRDDPRVQAVFEWLRTNYTLEENPGMGPQGLYYYFHTMAKALNSLGVDELELADGKKVNWRRDLALKLLDLQKGDGSWVNDNGRWWEKDPVLVTSYAVMALEIIHRGL